MTGYRQSMVFALEDAFGEGPGDNKWISPPPNTQFQSTHTRGTSLYTAMGTKTWEVVTYGQFQGQWSWTFILDYEYLEPFYLAFDKYSYDSATKTHTFSKCNAKRVRSFCIRRKILNTVAGGPMDETEILTGCVVSDIQFSRSAGNGSQIQVSMSGLYSNEKMDNTSLEATDYSAYDGDPVEYACLYKGGLDGEHISFVDQLSIGIGNSVSMVYGVCTPFPLNYSEGSSNYSIAMSAYANDPTRFKKPLYSGGYDNRASRPWAKDMKPMEKLTVIAYDKSRFNEYFDEQTGELLPAYANMEEAIEDSDKTVTFTIEKVILKSLTWASGDGSKLMDSISGTNARKVKMEVMNKDHDAELNLKTGGWHPLRTDGSEFDPCDL